MLVSHGHLLEFDSQLLLDQLLSPPPLNRRQLRLGLLPLLGSLFLECNARYGRLLLEKLHLELLYGQRPRRSHRLQVHFELPMGLPPKYVYQDKQLP